MKRLLVAGVIFLLALVIGAATFGRPVYRKFKERRAAELALALLVKGDHKPALMSAHQALLLNPQNAAALEVMAKLSEVTRAPEAVDWNRRLVEAAPTTENKLRLASVALKAQPPLIPLIEQLLEELRAEGIEPPQFHTLSAELALKANQLELAATHFERASQLEPTNTLHRLNLAAVRLFSKDAPTQEAARSALLLLAREPSWAAIAFRWLLTDALKRGDLGAAEDISDRLRKCPGATYDDQLQHLSVLKRAGRSSFELCLAETQAQAMTNAVQAQYLSSWLVFHGEARRALHWLMGLPPEMLEKAPLQLAQVEVRSSLGEWEILEKDLADRNWAEGEYLRHAYLSRCAAAQDRERDRAANWKAALRATEDKLGPLAALLNLANNWGWSSECENLLWYIEARYPREKWIKLELHRHYAALKNTRGLNRLYERLLALNPGDLVAMNNYAATCLLLQVNARKAHELAEKLHQRMPKEAIVVSTYAFSLHLRGQNGKALELMDQLSPEALERPAIALYYALFLQQAGQNEKAASFFKLAAADRELLPEEQALLASSGT